MTDFITPPPIRDPLFSGAKQLTATWNRWYNDLYQFVVDPPFSNVRAYLSANQTGILTGTPTKILFNTVSYDTQNIFSVASSSATVAIADTYKIRATASWQTSAATYTNSLFIYINGVSASENNANQAWTGTSSSLVIEDTLQLAIGDIITIYGQQTSGSNKAIDGGSTKTNFTVTRV